MLAGGDINLPRGRPIYNRESKGKGIKRSMDRGSSVGRPDRRAWVCSLKFELVLELRRSREMARRRLQAVGC